MKAHLLSKRMDTMIKQVIDYAKKSLLAERTPQKLAYASSVGIFIAFSPFLGIHWLMTIILAWALSLNVAVIYAAAHVVNNPLTMVPVYLADYSFGEWLTKGLFGVDLVAYNPSWMQWLNIKLSCLGIPNLSLWAFIIGGNILGLLVAVAAYPFLLRFYKRIIKTNHSV
jgi:uncharacterized protein (DUF2062 family)